MAATVPQRVPEISARVWIAASVSIMAIALVLRVYALDLKPLHHDEGVNGFFLTTLIRQGVYKYDPANYHGPTLYYLSLPTVVLFGLNTFAIRLMTALFGLGTVWLVLSLRRKLGSVAVLTAAALIAVSPGLVFYSRYFIHETLFVFFTLAIVAALVKLEETGLARYLMYAAASAALLFATKETAFISVGTLGLAWLVAKFWTSLKPDRTPALTSRRRENLRSVSKQLGVRVQFTHLGFNREHVPYILGGTALAIFLFINILFYSSFFTNWPGVSGALEALKVWSKTGTSDFHEKPFGTYIKWLLAEEAPILLLAVGGALIALFEKRLNRFAIFIGAWAFGILAAYSLIPYKTPWLVLSLVVPLAICAGYAIQALWNWRFNGSTNIVPALALAVLALALCTYQSFVLNFREYDNDQYPYVYSHSSRELTELVRKVEHFAEVTGNNQIGVSIASPEHWPLPWYFKDNQHVGFAGSVGESYDPNEVPIVIGRESTDPNEDQVARLRTVLGTNYQEVGKYTLRPGVRLTMFARSDLAGR